MNISAVVPLYNKAPYIKRALDSILAQTTEVDEIIVVDDGSTDNGSSVIDENFSDARIKIIKQENKGESAARNRGIEAASNELIAFLDADDEWKPEFIYNIQVLRNNFPDSGAYATSSFTIRPNGNIYYPDLSILPPEPWIGFIPNFFSLFQMGMAFNASSIVIPKTTFTAIGLFPPKVKHTADIDTWVRIAIKYPIAFSPKRCVIYHQEAENRTAPTHSVLEEFPVVRTILNAIEEDIIPEDALRKEALEFIAQKQLFVAINNILSGNTKKGVELLQECRYTKKYKKKWLFWRFWSYFPSFLPKTLLTLKEYLRGY